MSALWESLEKPVRKLKAFSQTQLLASDKSDTLTMKVRAYEMASFNEEHYAWETAVCTYEVLFGTSVADIKATASFRYGMTQA